MKTKHISTKTLLLYNLNQNEITNPTIILKDFCHHDHLPNHLKRLKYWRNLLLSNKTYNRRDNLSELFFHYRMTIKLLEAAWLLRAKGTHRNFCLDEPEKILVETFLNKEQKGNKFRLTALSTEALWNPRILFRQLFEHYKLADYRTILQYWMTEALSPLSSDELLKKEEIIIVYENLQKLYEASWLLYERSNKAKEVQN